MRVAFLNLNLVADFKDAKKFLYGLAKGRTLLFEVADGAKWPARLWTRGHRERRLHQPDVSVNATPGFNSALAGVTLGNTPFILSLFTPIPLQIP